MMTQTFSGHVFDPLDMKPVDVRLEDIAHSLSLQCRYNGQCAHFYSIAEHSIHVSNVLKMWGKSIGVQLAGFMHDAAEAYLGDVITPLKIHSRIGTQKFVAVEAHVETCIEHALNLPNRAMCYDIVKRADRAMLATEMKHLFTHVGCTRRSSRSCFPEDSLSMFDELPVPGIEFDELHPSIVEKFFLRRFSQLHDEWLDS
jgi:5'-deoxynucleotidase YfbR-like HD superfamily hydrolase